MSLTEEQILERTGAAYLSLIHPNLSERDEDLARVFSLAGQVSDQVISQLIVGWSWRERLLGLVLGVAQHPAFHAARMVESLIDTRGISLVPACAALAVLVRRGEVDRSLLSDDQGFDREAFNGEVGWGLDCANAYLEGKLMTDAERGPNNGQVFLHHVELFEWILDC